MKRYTFYLLPPVGGGTIKKDGTLIELLGAIPYLFKRKRLPPLIVLNSILRTGIADAGMSGGCEWTPFEIGQSQYDELADHCEKNNMIVANPPDWVVTWNDLQIWEFELDHGVPSYRHRQLAKAEQQASAELKAAIAQERSEEEISALHLKRVRAGNQLAEFLDEYF